MQGKRKGKERLRPGQLDDLVLGYMKKHKGELPLTPTKVAREIKRSSGAVGNCLGRLEKKEKVRLTDKKPRRYDLAGSAK
jgi:predicted RNA-binding protein (virulence factor B family)